MRLGGILTAFVLAMTFAMHAPIVCHAAHESCHHSPNSDSQPLPCCKTVMCVSALDARHDAVTPAPSLVSTLAPAPMAYLMPRAPLAETISVAATTPSPPGKTPLIIELRTLLI